MVIQRRDKIKSYKIENEINNVNELLKNDSRVKKKILKLMINKEKKIQNDQKT